MRDLARLHQQRVATEKRCATASKKKLYFASVFLAMQLTIGIGRLRQLSLNLGTYKYR